MIANLMERFPKGSLVRFFPTVRVHKKYTYGVVVDYKIILTSTSVEEFVVCKLRSHNGRNFNIPAHKLEIIEGTD